MLRRAVVFGIAAVWCLAASAADRPRVIAGAVFEDRLALAVRPHFIPAPGARVLVYRDGGDSLPSPDDAPVGTAVTGEQGIYLVRIEQSGNYWVVVDSRSIGAGKGWAEQTFGPAGARCAHPDGTERIMGFESPCFTGRSSRSDDASALITSEHVALVRVDEPATGVDFAFSFEAVTNTADGESIQGSFRQFLLNAATRPGPNRMRFVPVEIAPERRETVYGVPPRWWRISPTTSLPDVSDADTVIDGTAYNFLSAASPANAHPGRVGERATFRPMERKVVRLEKPDLELILKGEAGLVCTARCGVRGLAMQGTPVSIAARADARIEDVMIGSAPDALPEYIQGTIGVMVEKGIATIRQVLVSGQSTAGIMVARGARLDAERLDITGCGRPESGAGIVLHSDSSSIRISNISANGGAGVIIGPVDGSFASVGNSIDASYISANQAGIVLSPGSARNSVTRNDIVWNRYGGVTVAPFENLVPPRENRITANRFDENGLRPIILDLDVRDPNQLSIDTSGCQRRSQSANDGIPTPRVSSVRVKEKDHTATVVLRGKACPGQIVEIYQSFVTSGVRSRGAADLPQVRNKEKISRETVSNQERTRELPSIGEFNYLGATNTAPDGTFEASFSLALAVDMDHAPEEEEETDIWVTEVLIAGEPSDRAFSAIAIDTAGNTSEMSARRGVGEDDSERDDRGRR